MSKKWIPFWSDVTFRAPPFFFFKSFLMFLCGDYEELKDHEVNVTFFGDNPTSPRCPEDQNPTCFNLTEAEAYFDDLAIDWLHIKSPKLSPSRDLDLGFKRSLKPSTSSWNSVPKTGLASWSLRSHINNTLEVLGKPGKVPRSPASWCVNRWENSGKISRAANPTHGQWHIEDQKCCPTDSLIHEQYQILLGLPGWSGG